MADMPLPAEAVEYFCVAPGMSLAAILNTNT